MPIYEYECTSCCNVFEVFQRMTEEPLSCCPECSGPVKKLMSMSSFQLKGGGWYADGYNSNSTNESGSSPGNGATKATSTKTEDASASQAESTAPKNKSDCSATA